MCHSPVLSLLVLILSIATDDRALIFNPSVIHSLVEMLTSDDNRIRSTATELLKVLAPRRDILPVSIMESSVNPALVTMLKDDDDVRKTATELVAAFTPYGGSLCGSI